MSRLICISGCTRGLGRVLIERYISLGHRVAGCGRNLEELAILTKKYPSHLFVACDTSKDDQVKAFQQAFSTWSGGAPPSLLICNAAVVNKPRPLWEVSAAEFDEGYLNVVASLISSVVAAENIKSSLPTLMTDPSNNLNPMESTVADPR